jgi:hypothetical protein
MTSEIHSEKSINREEARKRAELESWRADMKQHADKLIQGFEKLEENHAKRAIWELFQNAIDLSEHCQVIIEHNEDSITFRHNGKPFTSNTLSCLIKQVSSKNPDKNEDEVGQYGTGFISTHSFGKRILVKGSLKEDNFYIPIENFEIDRIASSADVLIDKLIIQQRGVYNLVEHGELHTECNPFTSFTYETVSELEKQNASNAIGFLGKILPFVMMINRKLQEVKVYHLNGKETIYRKGEIETLQDLSITNIYINNDNIKIFSLGTSEDELIVILPLSEINQAIKLDPGLSRLFLYYPLIGTENFGFNFLIHSKLFAPTEPRDGIHLKSKNEQVQEKESNNRKIIESASQLIFNFVKEHSLKLNNPKSLAFIHFNSNSPNLLLNDYFTELQKEWIGQFKCYKLVETEKSILEPQKVMFFARELLSDEDYFPSIYSLARLFWENVPKEEIAIRWTSIIEDWNDDTLSFIKINDIVKKIEGVGNLDGFPNLNDHLKKFYKYLIIHHDAGIFNQHKLLPNIKGEFRLKTFLNSSLNIEDILIKVADVIIPEVPKRYIQHGFEFDLGFESYDRKQFSKDINSQISELSKSIKDATTLPDNILIALIDYCKIFPSIENSGTRGELVNLICDYYKIDSTFVSLPTITNQEMDWLTAMKCLLRNFIWVLNQQNEIWIGSQINLFHKLLSVIHSYFEFDDIVQTLPIFPNQRFELCKQNELKIDLSIPNELKDLFDKIISPKKSIRSTLILTGFGVYLKNGDTKTAKSLGDSIDKVFQDEMPYSEINNHPHSKEILWIIKKISDDENWAKYFPFIEEKKATIMMARISDVETKNDLFSIIGLEKKKIALLGELSREANLEHIIELGKMMIEEERQKKADFQFKYSIGKHIEDLIRIKIGADLTNFKVKVDDVQGGQDIVLEINNTIIYYIEVKSRWDIRNSITMSPSQMQKAVLNKEKYSLCCVDMCDYKNGDPERYNVTDIESIINRINVLRDIGDRIEPLKGVLSIKDIENEITITGDYRGTIPQSIVKTGQTFSNFTDDLIHLVKQNIVK